MLCQGLISSRKLAKSDCRMYEKVPKNHVAREVERQASHPPGEGMGGGDTISIRCSSLHICSSGNQHTCGDVSFA